MPNIGFNSETVVFEAHKLARVADVQEAGPLDPPFHKDVSRLASPSLQILCLFDTQPLFCLTHSHHFDTHQPTNQLLARTLTYSHAETAPEWHSKRPRRLRAAATNAFVSDLPKFAESWGAFCALWRYLSLNGFFWPISALHLVSVPG